MTQTYLKMQTITTNINGHVANHFSISNFIFSLIAVIVVIGVVLFLEKRG